MYSSTHSLTSELDEGEFFNWARRHEGVLGEWMYRSIYSLTSALDECEFRIYGSPC